MIRLAKRLAYFFQHVLRECIEGPSAVWPDKPKLKTWGEHWALACEDALTDIEKVTRALREGKP